MHDTEDIQFYYKHGLDKEVFFVENIAPLVPLDAGINPAKEWDDTAADLMVSGKVAELKTQETPFFTAGRFGLDPRFAVTFNRGDYVSYKQRYPGMDIYFMVDWQQLSYDHHGLEIVVAPLKAVYRVSFSELARRIESGDVKLHEYRRRRGDVVNETHSFVLDLREFELLQDFTDRVDLVVPHVSDLLR